jgi:hypothetical protein
MDGPGENFDMAIAGLGPTCFFLGVVGTARQAAARQRTWPRWMGQPGRPERSRWSGWAGTCANVSAAHSCRRKLKSPRGAYRGGDGRLGSWRRCRGPMERAEAFFAEPRKMGGL